MMIRPVSAFVATAAGCALTAAGQAGAQALPAHQTSNPWFAGGVAEIDKRLGVPSAPDAGAGVPGAGGGDPATGAPDSALPEGRARNVILFVGDGMGVSTLTAARILEGQARGEPGEENALAFEGYPHTALVKTYNVDAQTPDSAGTMTAMMSGVKTDVGVIGVDEDVERGECGSVDGNEVASAIELAELGGLATGIVSTARITHATPAAGYAKSADRNWEDDSDMPEEALAAGCIDIASQLVGFEALLEERVPGSDVDGIEVAMGGGRRHFLPKDAAFNSADAASEVEGDRTDGRDLTAEWLGSHPGGTYVEDAAGFAALDTSSAGPVLALFNESHMQYEADRDNDVAGEPSLAEMTVAAIEILSRDEDGFLLVVESGRIDHAHHAGSARGALTETIAFSDAVRAAMDAVPGDETLILVTADHGHVFTIAGYPRRGNPILGKVVTVGTDVAALAADGLPYTTLGYTNGRGFADLGGETDPDVRYGLDPMTGRQDLTSVDTTAPGFHQEALVPLTAETHAGEDIALHATGPGASRVRGVIEQNVVFHVIDAALGLTGSAE